ncbi:hypothetical protein niasHT_023971 [Heterodera trifolii]|uniref:ISXO2-like transposase domain-containing protein n=1 Tax=Heterodera trifolii TaxID=157864 RepID=A0ABD2JVL9_9BILA
MDIFAFCEQFATTEHTIAYMRNRGRLTQISPICGRQNAPIDGHNRCQRRVTQVKNATFVFDGCQWRCPTHKGQKISIRVGSFFKDAHFDLRKGMWMAYCWALGVLLHTQKQRIRMNKRTLIDWGNFFRGVCSRWLLDKPIRLGGLGLVIQIDESVLAKRKYHRGHRVREVWMFGLYDVHAGIGVIRIVPDPTRATLLPIIKEYVLPGSTIHSDQWAAYMGGAIPAIPVIPPYIHHAVHHTINFVDPLTGATQTTLNVSG